MYCNSRNPEQCFPPASFIFFANKVLAEPLTSLITDYARLPSPEHKVTSKVVSWA